MKNIAICYSENAIKVSNHAFTSSSSNSITPSTQNTVSCIYRIKLSTDQKQFLIKLTWSTSLNDGFSIGFYDSYPLPSSKISKNSRIVRGAKGVKSFEITGLRIEVIWDLTRAVYNSGPEPVTGFNIMVIVNSEISLVLGDHHHHHHHTDQQPGRASEYSLISRNERFNGAGAYSTRVKFSETGSYHDILIKCAGEDKKNGVLYVYIDKRMVIHVKRLQWNFRGNQMVFLDGLLVDLMWNLYDWFCLGDERRYGNGVFMFRTRTGLDNRFWLEEKKKKMNEEEKVGFSLMICASKNPD